jgi:hypothetical protein
MEEKHMAVQDNMFSEVVQRLSSYANFGDGRFWPSDHRPAPADVAILIARYRERRQEVRDLKRYCNALEQEFHFRRSLPLFAPPTPYQCRRRLAPLARLILRMKGDGNG